MNNVLCIKHLCIYLSSNFHLSLKKKKKKDFPIEYINQCVFLR